MPLHPIRRLPRSVIARFLLASALVVLMVSAAAGTNAPASAAGSALSSTETTTGGTALPSWSDQKNYPMPLTGQSISCPNVSDCWAVGTGVESNGADGVVDATTNGGRTWGTEVTLPGYTGALYGISCPSDSDCVAVGETILSNGLAAALVVANHERRQLLDVSTPSERMEGSIHPLRGLVSHYVKLLGCRIQRLPGR